MGTYNICKKAIQAQKAKGTLDAEKMQERLDVFVLAGTLDAEQYEELIAMLAE